MWGKKICCFFGGKVGGVGAGFEGHTEDVVGLEENHISLFTAHFSDPFHVTAEERVS